MKPTIPPATIWEFERLAHEVCELSGLDRQEKIFLSYELQTHLQNLYREGLALEMSGEQAQQRAVIIFGDPYAVAATLGGGDVQAMFLFENDRWIRLLLFMFACAVLYLVKVAYQTGAIFYFDPAFFSKFPQFLGSGFVAIALIYVAVRVRKVGLSIDNNLKVYFVAPFISKIYRWSPAFYERWCKVFGFVGRSTGEPSTAFQVALNVLAFPALWLALYASRDFLDSVLLVPHAELIQEFGFQVPGFKAEYLIVYGKYHFCIIPIVLVLQFFMIMSVVAELFEWWELRRSKNKYIAWFFYIIPKQLTGIFFPRMLKH
jgi:hypothetical protein